MAPQAAVAADQATEETVDKKPAEGTPSGQADDSKTAVSDDDAAGNDDADADEGVVELIPEAKFNELKGDPVKLHKELVRAVNKKFREVSDTRKSLEPFTEFIGALNEDPRAAIRALGTQLGMKFAETEEKVTAKTLNDQVLEAVTQALGPDYEDLAGRLAPAIAQVAQVVAGSVMKPVQDQLVGVINDSATRESNLALEAFAGKHPDWKKHETAMVEMSKKLPPGEGTSEAEYLESIYYLVTRERSSGDAVRRTVDKMRKSAESDTTKSTSVSDSNVSKRPTAAPTFREAYAAAKRGERLE